jgi:hypothetical protein
MCRTTGAELKLSRDPDGGNAAGAGIRTHAEHAAGRAQSVFTVGHCIVTRRCTGAFFRSTRGSSGAVRCTRRSSTASPAAHTAV